MKPLLKKVALIAVASTFFVTAPVFAQVTTTMTDAHIARIKANCQAAVVTLGQIHSNKKSSNSQSNRPTVSVQIVSRNDVDDISRLDPTDGIRVSISYRERLLWSICELNLVLFQLNKIYASL